MEVLEVRVRHIVVVIRDEVVQDAEIEGTRLDAFPNDASDGHVAHCLLSGARNVNAMRFIFVRLRNGESAGSCAVSCAGCLGLIILVAVALVGIGVLLGVSVYGGVSPAYNGPQ